MGETGYSDEYRAYHDIANCAIAPVIFSLGYNEYMSLFVIDTGNFERRCMISSSDGTTAKSRAMFNSLRRAEAKGTMESTV